MELKGRFKEAEREKGSQDVFGMPRGEVNF